MTFEWVKNKVALKLEAKYDDLTIFYNDKRIPEPFCLVDMGVPSGAIIVVHIREGAEIGLEKLEQQVKEEIEKDQERAD